MTDGGDDIDDLMGNGLTTATLLLLTLLRLDRDLVKPGLAFGTGLGGT